MKNYRVQDGCWNCRDCEIYSDWDSCDYSCTKKKKTYKDGSESDVYFEDVEPYGICDLYEKEET